MNDPLAALDQTGTISTRASAPAISLALRVYRRAEWACAVAAINTCAAER